MTDVERIPPPEFCARSAARHEKRAAYAAMLAAALTQQTGEGE